MNVRFLKTRILLAFTLLIMVGFLAVLVWFNEKTYKLRLILASAEGIDNGTMLMIKGVEIGSVENVSIDKNLNVEAIVSVRRDMEIPESSVFYIDYTGITGTKLITVEPGLAGANLKHGATVRAVDRTAFAKREAEALLKKLLPVSSVK